MWFVAVALSAALAMLAWQRAQHRPAHWPVANFVLAITAADVVRQGIALWILAPARIANGGAPFEGAVRFAFHCEQALLLLFPAGLAALACAVLLDGQTRRASLRAVAALSAMALVVLIAAYPSLRHEPLLRAYLALELTALAAVVAAGVSWWRRPDPPSLTQGSVLVFALLEFGAISHWRPAISWDWQNMMSAGASAALIFLHMGELWNVSKPRTTS